MECQAIVAWVLTVCLTCSGFALGQVQSGLAHCTFTFASPLAMLSIHQSCPILRPMEVPFLLAGPLLPRKET